MLFDVIFQTAVETWVLMVSSEIVVKWFVITTIVTTAYAMKTNHLNIGRLTRYAALFMLLFVAIIGPTINYAVVVLERPLTTPGLWVWPTFIFTLLSCLLLGFTLAFIGNSLIDLLFTDFWKSVADITYRIAEGQMKRSKAYRKNSLAKALNEASKQNSVTT